MIQVTLMRRLVVAHVNAEISGRCGGRRSAGFDVAPGDRYYSPLSGPKYIYLNSLSGLRPSWDQGTKGTFGYISCGWASAERRGLPTSPGMARLAVSPESCDR